jgi:nucleoside-diphosphate-sugar epimerase
VQALRVSHSPCTATAARRVRSATSTTIEGIHRLLHSDEPLPTNIGNPHEFSVRQLAEIVLELTGSASPLAFKELPEDDPKVRKPDITRARTMLGWEPAVDLREGVRRTIAYFQKVLQL